MSAMGYEEAAPVCPVIPDGRGDHLVIGRPVTNRSTHEWLHWTKVRSRVQGTLAGGIGRALSQPVRTRRLVQYSKEEGTPSTGGDGDMILLLPGARRREAHLQWP